MAAAAVAAAASEACTEVEIEAEIEVETGTGTEIEIEVETGAGTETETGAGTETETGAEIHTGVTRAAAARSAKDLGPGVAVQRQRWGRRTCVFRLQRPQCRARAHIKKIASSANTLPTLPPWRFRSFLWRLSSTGTAVQQLRRPAKTTSTASCLTRWGWL